MPPGAQPRPGMPQQGANPAIAQALALARLRQASPQPQQPVQRRAPNGDPIHTGALNVPVPGRTDHIAVTVPEGSYIIPADVVAHYGQGNTLAGQRVMEALFKGGVIKHMRQQGGAGLNKRHVPIAAAGGEYIVPPETVAHIGDGNMARGHAILDHFVVGSRAEQIKRLRKLPGPANSSVKGSRAA